MYGLTVIMSVARLNICQILMRCPLVFITKQSLLFSLWPYCHTAYNQMQIKIFLLYSQYQKLAHKNSLLHNSVVKSQETADVRRHQRKIHSAVFDDIPGNLAASQIALFEDQTAVLRPHFEQKTFFILGFCAQIGLTIKKSKFKIFLFYRKFRKPYCQAKAIRNQ